MLCRCKIGNEGWQYLRGNWPKLENIVIGTFDENSTIKIYRDAQREFWGKSVDQLYRS